MSLEGAVAFARIYADAEGQSHFVESPYPDRRDLEVVAGVSWRHFEPDQLVDWHTVSRRMYYVTLQGEALITVTDGETRRVGPGDISLVEDTTGIGHRTQIGPQGRICLVVTLPD